MDYIHILLIIEVDLYDLEPPATITRNTFATSISVGTAQTAAADLEPLPGTPLADWCLCGLCRPMSQAIESKYCECQPSVPTKCDDDCSLFKGHCPSDKKGVQQIFIYLWEKQHNPFLQTKAKK